MKLSICIPTFNRSGFLENTLSALLPLLDGDEQIVISDNASTDGTTELVKRFCDRFPNITYHRQEENIGASRNYLKVVELAEGEYCWLFGSDDLPVADSLTIIREAMANSCDIALFNYTWCNFKMKPYRNVFAMNPALGPTTFRISSDTDLHAYLRKVDCLSGIFSYLSTIVFKRSRWRGAPYDERFSEGAYSHTALLMTILREGANFYYDPRVVVRCRHGNDSFAVEGMFKRVMIDLQGYGAIRDILFPGDGEIAKQFNRVLRQDYPWWYLARLRGYMRPIDHARLLSEFRAIEYPGLLLRMASCLGGITPLWRLLVFLKIKLWLPLRRWFP